MALVLVLGGPVLSLPAAGQDARLSLSVAPVIVVEPGTETPLGIAHNSPDGLPRTSFLRIRGLPATAQLSDGHIISAGSWAVPLASVGSLRIQMAPGTTGRSEISIALVTIDGSVLTETRSALVAAPSALPASPTRPAAQPPAGGSAPRAALSTLASPPASPPPASLAPPPAAPPPLAGEARERARKLVQRGDEQLAEGSIAAARLYYERAVEIGLPEAAMAMAATFDADELARLSVRGIAPDAEAARRWYERARQLGAAGATESLRRLGAR